MLDPSPDTLFPKIITPTVKSADKLVSVVFEQHPLDSVADAAASVTMGSLDIVVNKAQLEGIAAFFTPKHAVDVTSLTAAASKQLDYLREATKLSLQIAYEQHKTLDLDVNVKVRGLNFH